MVSRPSHVQILSRNSQGYWQPDRHAIGDCSSPVSYGIQPSVERNGYDGAFGGGLLLRWGCWVFPFIFGESRLVRGLVSIWLIRSDFGLFLLCSAPEWVYCEYMLGEMTQDGFGLDMVVRWTDRLAMTERGCYLIPWA